MVNKKRMLQGGKMKQKTFSFFFTILVIFAVVSETALAGRYEIVKGKGVEVCEAYKRNLESLNEPRPMICERVCWSKRKTRPTRRITMSARRNRGLSPVVLHLAYLPPGATPDTRQHTYLELFRTHLDRAPVHRLRLALNQEQVLSSEAFKERIETTLNQSVRPAIAGRSRKVGVEEEAGSYVAQ